MTHPPVGEGEPKEISDANKFIFTFKDNFSFISRPNLPAGSTRNVRRLTVQRGAVLFMDSIKRGLATRRKTTKEGHS